MQAKDLEVIKVAAHLRQTLIGDNAVAACVQIAPKGVGRIMWSGASNLQTLIVTKGYSIVELSQHTQV